LLPVQNLGNLKNLKILSMQSNRVTKLENLEELESLEELYLSHNGVERLEGLEKNVGIKAASRQTILSLTSTTIVNCRPNCAPSIWHVTSFPRLRTSPTLPRLRSSGYASFSSYLAESSTCVPSCLTIS
jgi:Leucine-rich repeat (LRR) protein